MQGRTAQATARWAAAASALLLTAGALVVADAQPAAAETCSVLGCGDVQNNSGLWIRAAGGSSDSFSGWCWGDSAPRYGSGDAPLTCNHQAANVYTNENSSKYFKDTDSFRADAGCLTKFKVSTVWDYWAPPSDYTYTEDRRGKANDKWIKVWSSDDVTITYQTCSGSPTKRYVNTWAHATGYQDPYCYGDGGSGDAARCNADGTLYTANNYFFCKVWGDSVGTTLEYNHWWLLTDLDSVNPGRDGRSFVSAYHLTGGPNADNDTAYYYDSVSGTWKWFPDC